MSLELENNDCPKCGSYEFHPAKIDLGNGLGWSCMHCGYQVADDGAMITPSVYDLDRLDDLDSEEI